MAEAKKARTKKARPAASKKPNTAVKTTVKQKETVTVKAPAKAKTTAKADKPKRQVKLPGFLRAIVGYFVGSWREIRQVNWPNRKATWSLTLAVLVFTGFWSAVILSLDLLNQYLLNNLILN